MTPWPHEWPTFSPQFARHQIPAILMFALVVGYYALGVDTYPSSIGVTQRSCADPANDARLVFRQRTFCVTSSEAREWDIKWRIEYVLMALFAVSAGLSSVIGGENKK